MTTRYQRYGLLGLAALAALLVGVLWNTPGGAAVDGGGYPDSMASLGDSITRAANPEPSLIGDQPQYSWSTGSNNSVESHYYRILQQNSPISGNNNNDAVSGARMTDLNSQAQTAVIQGVDYVTILMGANDVCRPSEATMTAVETFRSQFQKAMAGTLAGAACSGRHRRRRTLTALRWARLRAPYVSPHPHWTQIGAG